MTERARGKALVVLEKVKLCEKKNVSEDSTTQPSRVLFTSSYVITTMRLLLLCYHCCLCFTATFFLELFSDALLFLLLVLLFFFFFFFFSSPSFSLVFLFERLRDDSGDVVVKPSALQPREESSSFCLGIVL